MLVNRNLLAAANTYRQYGLSHTLFFYIKKLYSKTRTIPCVKSCCIEEPAIYKQSNPGKFPLSP